MRIQARAPSQPAMQESAWIFISCREVRPSLQGPGLDCKSGLPKQHKCTKWVNNEGNVLTKTSIPRRQPINSDNKGIVARGPLDSQRPPTVRESQFMSNELIPSIASLLKRSARPLA